MHGTAFTHPTLTEYLREIAEEDDPTILQAALRGYAKELGMSNLVRDAGIKSRSSAYKSLSETGSPKWETLVKLAHSIIELSKQEQDKTLAEI